MFNLIAQYIGYGGDVQEDGKDESKMVDCSFGEAEQGEWMLVDFQQNADCDGVEDDFQRIPSPSPVVSMHSSTSDAVDVPVVSTVSEVVNKRPRCVKASKRTRTHPAHLAQHRPNQMKRTNQVFCNRGHKVTQKIRQIVHQPRKFC